MFALPPETKKKVFAEELVTIDHAKLTNMEEIGERISVNYIISRDHSGEKVTEK